AENWVVVCGVFIHPAADDNKKIYDYNYAATKQAIVNAMGKKPTVDEMIAKKDSSSHPFKGF
ncbi:MAG: formaldehyde-activating enzyme, partial [Pirellulaceae bacterium]